MDHAEAQARLAEAAETPLGLEHLDVDPSPEASALRDHLDACPDCRAESVAWQSTSAVLLDATPDTVAAPAEARDRILAAVVRDGVPRGAAAAGATPVAMAPEPVHLHRDEPVHVPVGAQAPTQIHRPGPVSFRRLALAAAAVLLVFVAGAILGPRLGLTPKDRSTQQLVAAVQTSDQILQRPGHRQAVLTRSDGTAAGTVLIDPATGDIVVISSEIDGIAADYHCSLIRDGATAQWIGPMFTQDGTSYWAGRVTNYADLGKPGDVVLVTDGDSAPELTATF